MCRWVWQKEPFSVLNINLNHHICILCILFYHLLESNKIHLLGYIHIYKITLQFKETQFKDYIHIPTYIHTCMHAYIHTYTHTHTHHILFLELYLPDDCSTEVKHVRRSIMCNNQVYTYCTSVFCLILININWNALFHECVMSKEENADWDHLRTGYWGEMVGPIGKELTVIQCRPLPFVLFI